MDHFIDITARPARRSMYPAEITDPMARDLTDHGFEGLETPDAVEKAITATPGTSLLVINSVCGCAAAMARPGVKMSIAGEKKPDNLFTVFAGVDGDAVQKARELLLPYPPSSPSIALFKDGKVVHFLERRHIEGRSAQAISENLRSAFENFC